LILQTKELNYLIHNLNYFKMCGGIFSFCLLHETFFGNGQVAITHNDGGMVSCRLRANFISNYTELQAGGNA